MGPVGRRMQVASPVERLQSKMDELKDDVNAVKEEVAATKADIAVTKEEVKAKLDHVILPDGTYSNQATVKREDMFPSLRDQMKAMQTVVMGDTSRWQVLEIVEWGLYLVKLPVTTLPRLEDATLFSWEDLQAKKARKA